MAAVETFPLEGDDASEGTSLQIQYNQSVAKFRDGYSQRALLGLNARKKIWTVVYKAIEPEEADEVEEFIEDRFGGVEPFFWTPPGADDPEEWILVPDSYRRTPLIGGMAVDITMTFEESFDP